jgi:hypothetical protein
MLAHWTQSAGNPPSEQCSAVQIIEELASAAKLGQRKMVDVAFVKECLEARRWLFFWSPGMSLMSRDVGPKR